ncbi:MAG: hypothetical protein GY771_12680 [bacterium]|nr:hypothetical protein [bacterium]
MIRIFILLIILPVHITAYGLSVNQLDDGLFLIEGAAPDAPIVDPDGDGFYFAQETDNGYNLSRYDADTNEVVELGISGIPLGFAFGGRSLVVEDNGRLTVLNEETYETEGIAGGTPVAFFGGNSQVFLSGGAIRIGNLYEGKSSRVDFDLGDFDDIYFYPISLKKIYFRIIRSDGAEEIYKIEAEKGGFEVSPVEGSGLVIDTGNRYTYFGG